MRKFSRDIYSFPIHFEFFSRLWYHNPRNYSSTHISKVYKTPNLSAAWTEHVNMQLFYKTVVRIPFEYISTKSINKRNLLNYMANILNEMNKKYLS